MSVGNPFIFGSKSQGLETLKCLCRNAILPLAAYVSYAGFPAAISRRTIHANDTWFPCKVTREKSCVNSSGPTLLPTAAFCVRGVSRSRPALKTLPAWVIALLCVLAFFCCKLHHIRANLSDGYTPSIVVIINDDRRQCSLRRCSAGHAAQRLSLVADDRCQLVGSRSFAHQSTSHVVAMTSRLAGATVCRRPVDGRDCEQTSRRGRRRRRQPRATSVVSTLMMMLVTVFITCDTGQPHLHLH